MHGPAKERSSCFRLSNRQSAQIFLGINEELWSAYRQVDEDEKAAVMMVQVRANQFELTMKDAANS